MRDGAPRPDATLAWAHFGASLACFGWRRDDGRWVTDRQVDTRQRLVLSSQAMEASVTRHFKDVVATPLTGTRAGIGELRNVLAAGYPRFFGMVGSHTFFHTPANSARRPVPRSWNRSSGPLRRPWMTPPAKISLSRSYSSAPRGEVGEGGNRRALPPLPALP